MKIEKKTYLSKEEGKGGRRRRQEEKRCDLIKCRAETEMEMEMKMMTTWKKAMSGLCCFKSPTTIIQTHTHTHTYMYSVLTQKSSLYVFCF